MPEPLVFLNHHFLPASQASLALWDYGIVQGATVTEMTRTFRKRPFRLDDHLDRLYRSLHFADIEPGISQAQLLDASLELVKRNAQLVSEEAELGLVHFVTAGEYPVYAIDRPPREGATVCAHTLVLPLAQWAKQRTRGVHLITPSVRQIPAECWNPHVKCRSRMHYHLSEREVRRLDPEAYALLLDLSERITETSSGNFFCVKEGKLLSPSVDYVLPGISRATVLELAQELDLPFAERDLRLSDVESADEAFLSGTSYCLFPVTRLNGVLVGEGVPGPTYRRILHAWSDRVGVDIEAQSH